VKAAAAGLDIGASRGQDIAHPLTERAAEREMRLERDYVHLAECMFGDRPAREPTSGELHWGRRFVVLAVVLGIAGVIVGGNASAGFFLAAMGCLLLFGYCFRHTIYGGGGGGDGGGF
jgi:hypothetical protein